MGQRETSAAATATGTSGRCLALGDPESKGVELTRRRCRPAETAGEGDGRGTPGRRGAGDRANKQTHKQTASNPEHNSGAISGCWHAHRTRAPTNPEGKKRTSAPSRARVRTHARTSARAQVTTVGCFAGDYKWHGGLVDAFGHIWCAGVVCAFVCARVLFVRPARAPSRCRTADGGRGNCPRGEPESWQG